MLITPRRLLNASQSSNILGRITDLVANLFHGCIIISRVIALRRNFNAIRALKLCERFRHFD